MMKNLLIMGLVSLLAFGCSSDSSDSGGGGEAPPAELTTEQRITVNILTAELGALEAVNRGTERNSSNLQRKLQKNMQQAYSEQLCDRRLSMGNSDFEQSHGITVGGSQCPIIYNYGEDAIIKNTSDLGGAGAILVTTKMDLFYKSKEATDMYKDTDIVRYEINMTGTATHKVAKDQLSSTITGSSTYVGTLVSKVFGSIPVSLVTSENSIEKRTIDGNTAKTGSETVTISIVFPDFKAEGVVMTDFSNEKAKTYSINGRGDASRSQFEYLFGDIFQLIQQ